MYRNTRTLIFLTKTVNGIDIHVYHLIEQRVHLIRDVFQDYNKNKNNRRQKNNEHKNQEE